MQNCVPLVVVNVLEKRQTVKIFTKIDTLRQINNCSFIINSTKIHRDMLILARLVFLLPQIPIFKGFRSSRNVKTVNPQARSYFQKPFFCFFFKAANP